MAPLKLASAEGRYDLRVRVQGGGPTGQAGAVRHGIARALVEADPELRVPLKREGFLTRDARKVERKKAGLHKARKRRSSRSANWRAASSALTAFGAWSARTCPRTWCGGWAARALPGPDVAASSSGATREDRDLSWSRPSRKASHLRAETPSSQACCRLPRSRCSRSTWARSSPPRTTLRSTTGSSSSTPRAAS